MIQEICMHLAMFFYVCELERALEVTEIASASAQQLWKTSHLPCFLVPCLNRDHREFWGQLLLWLGESPSPEGERI